MNSENGTTISFELSTKTVVKTTVLVYATIVVGEVAGALLMPQIKKLTDRLKKM
jgi:hypothetical protein